MSPPHGLSLRPAQAAGGFGMGSGVWRDCAPREAGKEPRILGVVSRAPRFLAFLRKQESKRIQFAKSLRDFRRSCASAGGSTLVEILVTVGLMALVGGAAVAVLSGGIRVWERASGEGTHQEAAQIAFARLRTDLRNSRRFAPIPFKGAYGQYEAAHVESLEPDPSAPPEVGRLGYFLNERQKVLCRSFTPYRLMEHVRLSDRCQSVMDDVTRLRFSYLGKSEEGGEVGWVPRWDSSEPPIAIKIELTVQGPRQASVSYASLIPLQSFPLSQNAAEP